MSTTDALPEPLGAFTLSGHGPLTSLLNRVRPMPRAIAVAAVAWGPVALLAVVEGLRPPAALNLRLLVSLPLLILVEPFVDGRLRACLREFYLSPVLEPPGRQAMPRLVEQAEESLASWQVEVLLAAVSLGLSLSALLGPRLESGGALPEPARAYFLLVSFPLFRFVLLRWLWRFVVWSLLLWRLASLPLRPQVTHPDGAGGLGFLGRLHGAFAAVVLGLSFTVAGMARLHATTADVPLSRQFTPLIVLAAVSVIVIFAPLLAFLPRLLRTRRRGIAHMERLASHHSRRFEQTWFDDRGDPLGSPDMSSLTDLGSSFFVTRRMKVVPLSLQPAMIVVAAALLPALPILAREGQLFDILMKIGRSLM